jgi:hypothetical protein
LKIPARSERLDAKHGCFGTQTGLGKASRVAIEQAGRKRVITTSKCALSLIQRLEFERKCIDPRDELRAILAR